MSHPQPANTSLEPTRSESNLLSRYPVLVNRYRILPKAPSAQNAAFEAELAQAMRGELTEREEMVLFYGIHGRKDVMYKVLDFAGLGGRTDVGRYTREPTQEERAMWEEHCDGFVYVNAEGVKWCDARDMAVRLLAGIFKEWEGKVENVKEALLGLLRLYEADYFSIESTYEDEEMCEECYHNSC